MDLTNTGVLLVQGDTNWEQINFAMQNGQVAFWTAQAGQPEAYWFYDGNPPYEVGVATMPRMPEGVSTTYWANEMGHIISASAENPQACWDWFKYLSEQPDVFAGIPARKSVAQSPAWEALVGAENAAVYRAALAQVQRFDPTDQAQFNPISWPFYTWRQQLISGALKGEDYQKLAAEMQRKADDYLACMALVDRTDMTDEEINNEVNKCAQQVDPDGPWAPGGGWGGGGG